MDLEGEPAVLDRLLGLSAVWFVHSLPPPAKGDAASRDGSEPYRAARLEALRAEGRPVFVNMTADWCVTCKANEKTVLSTPAFAAALQTAGAVYLKGDWTNVDPEITQFLEAHGGTVELESKKGKGTTVTLTIPRGAK